MTQQPILQWSMSCANGPNELVEINLEGEVDLSSADILREALAEGLQSGATTVIVDAARLTYLDSSGIACLVVALKDAAAVGSRLVVRQPTATVRRVLEITELDRILLDGGSDGQG